MKRVSQNCGTRFFILAPFKMATFVPFFIPKAQNKGHETSFFSIRYTSKS